MHRQKPGKPARVSAPVARHALLLRMFARDQILDILSRLALWYWPIFFWDLVWLERYYRAYRAAHPIGMMAAGVTREGRILITLQAAGDTSGEPHWTDLAPRAPWIRLEPGLIASPFGAALRPACDRPEIGPVSAYDRPAIGPLNLAPG